MFHRNKCDSCCDSCGTSTGGTVAPKGEPIPSPKKMPTGATEPPGSVRIITPPSTVAPVTTPALEVAPAAVPGLDADNRNPF
jgi:hypothetical protein